MKQPGIDKCLRRNARSLLKPIMITLVAFLVCFQFSGITGNCGDKKEKKERNKYDSAFLANHSAKKASIYSAILPGLGQGYNKKYWKIPIIYAGFGVFAYMISTNGKEFRKFKEAYLWKVGDDTIPPPDNNYIYEYETVDQLKRGMEYYLRNYELSWILTGVWYILNIIDATVDAHLMDYDISEDLTLRIDPGLINDKLYYNQPVAGMTITLKF